MSSNLTLSAIIAALCLALGPLAASASAAPPEQAPQREPALSPVLVQAMTLAKAGKNAEAIQMLDGYVNANPGDYRGLWLRASVYYKMGDAAAALADFQAAIALRPNVPQLQFGACGALYKLHRLDDAIAACAKAIALDPTFVEAYNERALARDAKDDASDEAAAIGDVDRAIELQPNAWSYSERCELKLELERYADAIPDCDRALAMNPTSAWTLVQRGRLALATSDFPTAQTDFQAAIDNGTTITFARVFLAQAQLGLGRYPDALANVNAFIDKYPKASAEAYLTRAKIEAKMGRTQDALGDAKEASAEAQSQKNAGVAADAAALLGTLSGH